jgi:hypothetical protein
VCSRNLKGISRIRPRNLAPVLHSSAFEMLARMRTAAKSKIFAAGVTRVMYAAAASRFLPTVLPQRTHNPPATTP